MGDLRNIAVRGDAKRLSFQTEQTPL